MASTPKVINLTNGCRIKRSQAIGRVENCASAWVIEGESIRDLTLAERVQARSVQARLHEPIAMAELPGVVFQEPPSAAQTASLRYALVREANRLVAGVA